MSPMDNALYVERRAVQCNDAEARRDVAAAQAARRHLAIEVAIRRMQAVADLNTDRTLTRSMLEELLTEIVRDLEAANRVRSSDPEVTK